MSRALLRASENQRLRFEVVETALALEFPAEESGRQVETIIDWGRYAELPAYDDDSGSLSLEPAA